MDKTMSAMQLLTDRAQGCLLGQLSGDALGSLVEFRHAESIARAYPGGVRQMQDGGTWNTLAGQPTDDSEMALALVRMLVERRHYTPEAARAAYVEWLESSPFDRGSTVTSGLLGQPNAQSEANGALMRVSPLGIFSAGHSMQMAALWAEQDAAITHPHPVCRQTNALFVMAIRHAILHPCAGPDLYDLIALWATHSNVEPRLMDAIARARTAPPEIYVHQQGWVLIAFQNALWQLLHTPDLEEAVVDTIMRGGDTDTNAAICGALLGAVHGRGAVPGQWVDAVLSCRPAAGLPHVHRPRPESYWPVDALDLAEQLLKMCMPQV